MATREGPRPVAALFVALLIFVVAGLLSSLAIYAAWVAYFVSISEQSAWVFIKLVIVKPVVMLFGYRGPDVVGDPAILKAALIGGLTLSLLLAIWSGVKVYRRSSLAAGGVDP